MIYISKSVDDKLDEYAAFLRQVHDLCFPSKKQIAILKRYGYKGLIFKYTDDSYSILILAIT